MRLTRRNEAANAGLFSDGSSLYAVLFRFLPARAIARSHLQQVGEHGFNEVVFLGVDNFGRAAVRACCGLPRTGQRRARLVTFPHAEF